MPNKTYTLDSEVGRLYDRIHKSAMQHVANKGFSLMPEDYNDDLSLKSILIQDGELILKGQHFFHPILLGQDKVNGYSKAVFIADGIYTWNRYEEHERFLQVLKEFYDEPTKISSVRGNFPKEIVYEIEIGRRMITVMDYIKGDKFETREPIKAKLKLAVHLESNP